MCEHQWIQSCITLIVRIILFNRIGRQNTSKGRKKSQPSEEAFLEVSITCTHINAQSQARTMTDVAFVRNCSHSLPDPQQRLRERADVIKARRPGAGFVEQQRNCPDRNLGRCNALIFCSINTWLWRGLGDTKESKWIPCHEVEKYWSGCQTHSFLLRGITWTLRNQERIRKDECVVLSLSVLLNAEIGSAGNKFQKTLVHQLWNRRKETCHGRDIVSHWLR